MVEELCGLCVCAPAPGGRVGKDLQRGSGWVFGISCDRSTAVEPAALRARVCGRALASGGLASRDKVRDVRSEWGRLQWSFTCMSDTH